MPNKKLDAMKIPFEYSKRKKLSPAQRVEIADRVRAGESQRALALEYEVSRRLISFIVNPDKYEISKAQRRERYQTEYKDGRYYDKEQGTKNIADLRRRKRLYLAEKT